MYTNCMQTVPRLTWLWCLVGSRNRNDTEQNPLQMVGTHQCDARLVPSSKAILTEWYRLFWKMYRQEDENTSCTHGACTWYAVVLMRASTDNSAVRQQIPGTHWLWEVLGMLHQGEAETIRETKQTSMIEAMTEDALSSLPSPRIFNTHMWFRTLPKDMIAKKTKLILIHRNPKDVAVSHYNHHHDLKIYDYSGKWENFLQLFMEGHVEYGCWFDYVRNWERVMEENPGYPIHLMYYEDMKENSRREVERIAEFLELPVSKDVCAEIADKCQFSNMKADKQGLENDFFRSIWRDNKPQFYRKGQVGDWKNWFTVAQNEMFDELYQQKMVGSKLKFRFEI